MIPSHGGAAPGSATRGSGAMWCARAAASSPSRGLAVAVVAGGGQARFRRTYMGLAVPDGPEPLGAGRCQAAAAAPDTAGEGQLGHAAGRPLVSRPTPGDGGGWRLRQPGRVLDAAAARGVRGALPHGCALLQPAAAT